MWSLRAPVRWLGFCAVIRKSGIALSSLLSRVEKGQ